MEISTRALAEAKEAAASILQQLGIEAYLFGVEPRAGPWEVRVECACAGGWETTTLSVARQRLLASREDGRERALLLEEWRARLAGCKRT